MARPICEHCGKPVLPGSRFCSNSCDAGAVMTKRPRQPSSPSPGIASLLPKGVKSVSVIAVEFSPRPDARGPQRKHKPTLWEARVSDRQNGDSVARREDPDEALRDALSGFAEYKKTVTPKAEPDDDDGLDLI